MNVLADKIDCDEVAISSIEEIIADAKKGKMFILVDDEDRENEGDLIIPAEVADADAINFMAKYGRGLICLAMTKERTKQLGLSLMSQYNQSRHQTAFTTSIEAREGVTTGISAADRAKTVEVAIDPEKGEADIATPGHVFPLVARKGGVLVRAGHTEAAVDIAKLAGLNPSGVICEIMNDDGTMARISDLTTFSKQHDLKIGTIADLISYRRKNEKIIKREAETVFNSAHGGEFKLIIYVNTLEYAEHIALVKGDISDDEPTLVRMHALDVLGDVLGNIESDKAGTLRKSMEIISDNGSGVIVLLREAKKNSLSQKIKNNLNSEENVIGNKNLRDYGVGAQILLDLGVRDMTLLTNSERSVVALEGYGLTIKGYKAI